MHTVYISSQIVTCSDTDLAEQAVFERICVAPYHTVRTRYKSYQD